VAQHDDLDGEIRVTATDQSDELKDTTERPVEEREGHRWMLSAPESRRQSASRRRWMAFSAPTGFTETFGERLLQRTHRRIFSVVVIADDRIRHGVAHVRRRLGHGVTAQVDHVGHSGEPNNALGMAVGTARTQIPRPVGSVDCLITSSRPHGVIALDDLVMTPWGHR
jgi:hypothetical protein